jgi:hypothetical protein
MELSCGHPVKAAYLSIVAHLEIILRLENRHHPKLRDFQNEVRSLFEQLDESMKTPAGVRQWLQTLEANRKQLGCVQYHRACPYGRGCGDLIDTPENRVLQYIHSQIDACRTDAYKILEVFLEEEKNQKEKNQYLVNKLANRLTTASSWDEIPFDNQLMILIFIIYYFVAPNNNFIPFRKRFQSS